MSQRVVDESEDAHRHHYEVEVRLADRLRSAPTNERTRTYSEVYDELFREVPEHPQLSIDPADRDRIVSDRLRFILRFCDPESTFLEIGAGDCALSNKASRHLRRVVALDVSEEIMGNRGADATIEKHVIDGTSFPLGSGSVDVAFSDQLLEHLHPEDAAAQVHEVRRTLGSGGVYICITPNRSSGPHDVTRYFGDVARGFHLREYDARELEEVFRAAGFNRFRWYLGGRGRYVRVPGAVLRALERVFRKLPRRFRLSATGSTIGYLLLGLNLVAGCTEDERSVGK